MRSAPVRVLLSVALGSACFTDAGGSSSGSDTASGTGGSGGSTGSGSAGTGSGGTSSGSASGGSAGTSSGSGASGGGSSGGGSSGGGSSGGVNPGCEQLCSLLTDHCADADAQYSGTDVCLAVCQHLPPGEMGAQTGNSVECRRSQAIQAAEMPDVFCDPAGPSGSGICGGDCESFCFLADKICTGPMQQFPSIPDCIQDCMGFPTDPPYDPAVHSGDTFGCRLYHLTVAALDPGTHCGHIVENSPICL